MGHNCWNGDPRIFSYIKEYKSSFLEDFNLVTADFVTKLSSELE
jgi:hypothetical protein